LGEEQKNKILSVIQQRQKFIEETIAKQPKIEVGELFLEATIKRGEELQKIRDKITSMATEAYKVAPEIKIGILSTAPLKELEDRLEAIKGIKPEFKVGREEELKNTIKYLEEIIKLRKEEAKISSFDYLGIIEERLQNEKEFAKASKEYQEDNADLTIEQKAQLNLERELSTFAIKRGVTETQILQRKIELLKVSEQFNNEQERTLAIEKTQNQLIDARLQKRKQEEDKLASLAMQYEKADASEKSRLRRVAELATMTPESFAAIYQSGGLDKTIIEDYWNYFTEEAQVAATKTIEIFREMQNRLLTPEERKQQLIEGIQKQIGTPSGLWQGTPQFATPQTSPVLEGLFAQFENKLLAGLVKPTQVPTVLTSTYNIPITLEGAITNEDIQGLLQKIEEEIKKQPNYISDESIDRYLSDEENKRKLAQGLRPKI
jgi:hypothetical protein